MLVDAYMPTKFLVESHICSNLTAQVLKDNPNARLVSALARGRFFQQIGSSIL